VYYSLGIEPHISFNPDPERLFEELLYNTPPPTLIHIIAAVRETSGGTYLDFVSTARRTASFDFDSRISELSMTAFRLDRILAALREPPFVVLDISRPYNMTEAVRMLLLRNLFATQLFELGHVRGVLGHGFAQPWERLTLSYKIVEFLVRHNVAQAVHREDGPSPTKLEEALPHLAAALWTNHPDDYLFNS
jgi:cellulose synthase operon protein C